MSDDNLFDEDDALDYIIYEEVEKEVGQKSGKSGCLGLFVVPALFFPLFQVIWHR